MVIMIATMKLSMGLIMAYKFNISIDDVSPHPLASIKVLDRCHELVEEFPKIKFSLFVPLAYWRTGRAITVTKKPLFVSEFPDFCQVMKDLSPENFELGYHGFYHGKPKERNDNNELDGLDYNQSSRVIKSMLYEAERSGLKDIFKPMLRPPNWKMCPEAFDAANDLGIKLFALTDIESRIETHGGRNEKYNSVYSNFSPPNRALKLNEKCGVVFHACEWLKNYLDKKNTQEIIEFIKKNEEDIEFCFLEDFL